MFTRSWPGACAAILGLALAGGAHAAKTTSVSYVWPDQSNSAAYVVDWKPKSRAHVGNNSGAADGGFTDDGTQRVVTFDAPISITFDSSDCNGNAFSQRTDLTQVVFRPATGTALKGTTQVVEIGTVTDIGGCTPGQVVPFGSPGDPGMTMNHLDMTQRASIADLTTGAQLAGMSDSAYDPHVGQSSMPAQVTTLGASTITFEGSHATYARSLSDKWFAVALATGEDRRYTRLTRNGSTGVEVWLVSDFVGGQTGMTWQTLMTKPVAGATFGTVKQASRQWDSGLFMTSSSPLLYELYKDLTGYRVLTNADGSHTSQPLTWSFVGTTLQDVRITGATQRIRSWVPIANYGKNHFVFEDEYWILGDGSTYVFFPARVNYYVDEGVSVQPPPLGTREAGVRGRSGEASRSPAGIGLASR